MTIEFYLTHDRDVDESTLESLRTMTSQLRDTRWMSIDYGVTREGVSIKDSLKGILDLEDGIGYVLKLAGVSNPRSVGLVGEIEDAESAPDFGIFLESLPDALRLVEKESSFKVRRVEVHTRPLKIGISSDVGKTFDDYLRRLQWHLRFATQLADAGYKARDLKGSQDFIKGNARVRFRNIIGEPAWYGMYFDGFPTEDYINLLRSTSRYFPERRNVVIALERER